MAYDTLTAWVSLETFHPDPQLGWRPANVQTKLNLETGEVSHTDKWVWNDGGYDFTWFPDQLRLQLQVSIPRVFRGDNIEPWEPGDPDAAWEAEREISVEVSQRLAQPVQWWGDWGIYRLDATSNYQLAGQGQVLAVLRVLQRRRLPHHRSAAHLGESGSVMWEGRTRRYVAYSKYLEVLERLGDKQAAAKAEGVLRAEARVEHGFAVRRVLEAPLRLETGDPVTVARVMDVQAVPVVSTAVLGRLEGAVSEAIGGLAMANTPGLEDLVRDLGPSEAAKVIGIHVLYRARGGEDWLRQVWGDKGNYSRTMKRLKDLGLDPRTVDLGLGRQLQLFDSGDGDSK